MSAQAFTIPSIFTAIDKLSGPVRAMTANVQSFASKSANAVARSERIFNKLTPTLGAAQKQFLSFASSAAIAGGIISGGAFAVKSLMDYETELANLKAITGATGKEFEVFKGKINDVAKATGKSSVEVTQAFTAIANNQPALLKDANALAMVTQSSILLAQASKMELQPAGEALTQILNQFGKGAADAAKTVDILAAGSVAGSSEIRDTADAIKQFGTVAANAGVKINESVALIELASKFEKGSEAGVKLRNILITMSAIKVQDPKALKDLKRLGVNMDIVSNSSLPLQTRLKEISKISADNAALFHVFGKENQAMAAGVLSTSDKFGDMLNAVETNGEATRMATVNNNTLAISIEHAKAKFVNLITGANGASDALDNAKKAVKFLTDNMETILSVGFKIIKFFTIWKLLIISSKIAIYAYNVALGIYNALTKTAYVYTKTQTVAMETQLIATRAITAAQWLWNAAMAANPIGLIIIAILALGVAVTAMIANWDSWGKSIANVSGPLGGLAEQVKTFADNWTLVTNAFSEEGFGAGIKAIGRIILSNLLWPLEKALEIMAAIAMGKSDFLNNLLKSTQTFRKDFVTQTDSGNPVPGGLTSGGPVNPKAAEQDAMMNRILTTTERQKVSIDINDKSNGKANVKTDNDIVPINLTSTLSWGMNN